LLVLRFASCEAVFRKGGRLCSRKTSHRAIFSWPASAGWCCAWHPAMPIDEGGLPEHRSELYSRKTQHRAVFSWQTQFAGAAHGILPCS
jgi:hypothetical protein